MWTAVAQVRAAAPQSEFPTDELALFWVLEAEVLFSLWLLFRQCDRVARSFNQPQVFAGYLRWLLLGQAIAFSWGTAHLPNF